MELFLIFHVGVDNFFGFFPISLASRAKTGETVLNLKCRATRIVMLKLAVNWYDQDSRDIEVRSSSYECITPSGMLDANKVSRYLPIAGKVSRTMHRMCSNSTPRSAPEVEHTSLITRQRGSSNPPQPGPGIASPISLSSCWAPPALSRTGVDKTIVSLREHIKRVGSIGLGQ